MSFREILKHEVGEKLVNQTVKVYWDDAGGGSFYQGKVVGFLPERNVYQVIYDDSNTMNQDAVGLSESTADGTADGDGKLGQEVYEETLDDTWLIYDSTIPDRRLTREKQKISQIEEKKHHEQQQLKQQQLAVPAPKEEFKTKKYSASGIPAPRNKMPSKATYTDMILEALRQLHNPSGGTSLVAVRKWICANNPNAGTKQKASFNNLTKKAALKLVADDMVVRTNKTCFRLSPFYIDRLKKAEAQRQREIALAAAQAAKAAKMKSSAALSSSAFSRVDYGGYYGDGSRSSFMRRSSHSLVPRQISPEQALINERNRELRDEYETALDTRNTFLKSYRAYVEPFLPDDKNFFHKLEIQEQERKAELEMRRREEKIKTQEQKWKELEAQSLQEVEGERLGLLQALALPYQEREQIALKAQEAALAAFQQQEQQQQRNSLLIQQQQQQLYNQRQQQAVPSLPQLPPSLLKRKEDEFLLDYRSLPLEGGPEYKEIMIQMGFIDKAHLDSNVVLGITGRPLEPRFLLPPLQMDSYGSLTMEDRMLIDTILPSGPFANYKIIWPGSRLPFMEVPKDTEKDLVNQHISWQNVYWLSKPETIMGGLRQPNVLALRLMDGRFVPHRFSLMRTTMKYAEVKKIPIDNLCLITYRCPRTGEVRQISRDYCWVSRYQEAVRRGLKSRTEKMTLQNNLRLQQLIDSYARPSSGYHPPPLAAPSPSFPPFYGGAMAMPPPPSVLPPPSVDDSHGQLKGVDSIGAPPSVQAVSLPTAPAAFEALKREEAKDERNSSQVIIPPVEQEKIKKIDGPGVEHSKDETNSTLISMYAPDKQVLPSRPSSACTDEALSTVASGGNGGAHEQEEEQVEETVAPTAEFDKEKPEEQDASKGVGATAVDVWYSLDHAAAPLPPSSINPAPTPAPMPQLPFPAPTVASGQQQQQQYGYPPHVYQHQSLPQGGSAYPYPFFQPPPQAAGVPFAPGYPLAGGVPQTGPQSQPRPAAASSQPVPAAPPVRDQSIKARLKWLAEVTKKVQQNSVEEYLDHCNFLLDGAKDLAIPSDILNPIHQAVEKVQKLQQDMKKVREEAIAALEAENKSKEATESADHDRESPQPAGPLEDADSTKEAYSDDMKEQDKMDVDGEKMKEEEEEEEEEKEQLEPEPKRFPVMKPINPLEGVKIIQASRSIIPKLHEHQVEGLSWLVHMYRNGMPTILGDQMGLGKTLQSIAFLAYLKDNFKIQGPHLVVVPLSVMSNWISEIERFCPSMRCVRFHGPKQERARIKQEELGDIREFDLVVTTYEMLTAEVNYFRRKFFWRVVIVDEGHRLKNEKSQLSENLRKLPAYYRLILTGTPCQNNLRELWALFHYLLPDVFTSAAAEKFEEGFDAQRSVLNVERLKQAHALLSLLMLRRRKDQISMTLPPKTELAVVCGLSEVQRAWYKRVLTGLGGSMLLAPDQEKMNDNEWRKLLNILLQLRKVCNHPYLMMDAEYRPNEEMVESSGKLKILDRMLPKMKEDGHRVLLFSQFTSMLDILEDYCQMRGHEYVRLDGSTNRVQRRLDLRRYNAPGSNIFIFLISTRAGGVGINLATADTVILYDSDWNPQVDLQAMERAHRIGQTKPVRVYRLVVRASVEERMVSRAHKKLFLNEMVAEQEKAQASSAIAEELGDLGDDGEEGTEGAAGKGEEEEGENAIAEMSSMGGANAAIAKDEVARMIRTGVTALFDANKGVDVTDEELDVLLGRKEGSVGVGLEEENDEGAVANYWQNASEMKLEEVDVRHLEGVNYKKQDNRQKKKDMLLPEKSGVNLEDLDLGVRKRKQRLVMIDGKGTGYGGAVPVLAEEYYRQEEEDRAALEHEPILRRAHRDWVHEKDCFVCGLILKTKEEEEREEEEKRKKQEAEEERKRKKAEEEAKAKKKRKKSGTAAKKDEKQAAPGEKGKKSSANAAAAATAALEDAEEEAGKAADADIPPPQNTFKCGYCPKVFHIPCLSEFVENELEGSMPSQTVCPHHNCCNCKRSTSAAGGLLFRCVSCPRSFCEDCLEEDVIESLGRWKPLEELGYFSKQSYFIRCPTCLRGGSEEEEEDEAEEEDEMTGTGDDGTAEEEGVEQEAEEEGNNMDDDEGGEEEEEE